MWQQTLNTMGKDIPMKAIQCWDGIPSSLHLVSKGINLVYRFENPQGIQYLRLTHPKLRCKTELAAALDFQQHLATHQVAICHPVYSKHHRLIEQIPQGQDYFLAHVCHAVPGTPINFDYSDLHLYQTWGAELAKLHQASFCFKPDKKAPVFYWHQSFVEMEIDIKKEAMDMQHEFYLVKDFFDNLKRDNQNFAMTHGDHRKGNVLTDGTQVNIIDFDMPRYHWLMEDIARPFFSSIVHEHHNWQNKLEPYLAGYQSVKNISESDRTAFPWFTRMKALEMYCWLKYHWDAEFVPGGIKTTVWLKQLKKLLLNKNPMIHFFITCK